MSERRYHDRIVVRNPRAGRTDVWHKNSGGGFKREQHRTFDKNTRIVTNHWGKKVGKF